MKMNQHKIPIINGKQLYNVDQRSLRSKLLMCFWKHFGKQIRYNSFYGVTISGEKTRYYGCRFTRCSFERCKLVFLEKCMIEHETPHVNFINFHMCEVKQCLIKKIKPLITDVSTV